MGKGAQLHAAQRTLLRRRRRPPVPLHPRLGLRPHRRALLQPHRGAILVRVPRRARRDAVEAVLWLGGLDVRGSGRREDAEEDDEWE